MKKHRITTPFAPLSFALNMILVYVMYAVCRVAYYLENFDAFSLTGDGVTWQQMFKGSLVFDTSAILYTNALYALLMLLPFTDRFFNKYIERIARWVFVAVNSICVYMNLADGAYFRFTGRRTTSSVFQEFGNENNLFGIFLTEVVNHWYLLLLGIAITMVLAKAYVYTSYKQRQVTSKTTTLVYYSARVIVLLLFVPLCVGGMRGGLGHGIRPITISNANQYVSTPADAALILNTPFSMLRTISKKSFVDPGYFSEKELNSIYSPVKIPVKTDFRRKNIVILIVESFGREYIGAMNKDLDDGNYRGFTPNIDSLVERSLTFDYSFANGRKSIDGMPSILSSIPMFVEPFFLTSSSMNDVSGIAGELGKEGYHSTFFHGAPNGSMGFEAFAKATGFKEYYGKDEYESDKRFGGKDDFDGSWAIWDEPFLQFFAKTMSGFREPFVSVVFTASSHHPFNVPDKYRAEFKDVDSNPIHKCIRYTDKALGEFFRTAERQPWYKNTIFVMTSDHTNISDHDVYRTDLGVYSAPIIIYDPSGDIAPGRSHHIAQQIDIMPTLLSYIGYPRPYIAFGENLLDGSADDSWAVNYNNGVYQYVKGEYFMQYDGEAIKALYNFRNDPLQKHNIISSAPKAEVKSMEKELKAIIQSYMKRMHDNQLIIK